MRVGYIKLDRQEKFNLKRAWFVQAWRIVDEKGNDLVQPRFKTKRDLYEFATRQGMHISQLIVQVKQWNTYVTLREHCRINSESTLFYEIKKELKRQGYDCIKKRPDRDGHMTSAPFYIRARDKSWCILDQRHEIRNPADEINREGSIILRNYWAIPTPKEGNNDRHNGTPDTGIGEH
jgi:hypothetical protein